MESKRTAAKTIDEYIAQFPSDVQALLEQVRAAIRTAAPEAKEAISYQIPAFNLNGRYLIYFAGYKKHIGLYPVPGGDEAFQQEIAAYQAGKGTLRFPLDRPIPLDLIAKVVRLRAKENEEHTAAKKKPKQ